MALAGVFGYACTFPEYTFESISSDTCQNSQLDDGEEDVDCGGSCAPCGVVTCEPDDVECHPETCYNRMLDDGEVELDCGGPCAACPGSDCTHDEVCADRVCTDEGVCARASCDDDSRNGDETGKNCGGSCPGCPDGSDCIVGDDCESKICDDGGKCQESSCDDGVQNGGESDIDCGSPLCPCGLGERCENANNCESGYCDQMVCVLDHCIDEQRDVDWGESDIDCGGDCAGCDTGEMCDGEHENCKSSVCGPDQTCLEATCDDDTLNGDETDVDCGGEDECGRCEVGEMCNEDGDCEEHVCVQGECAEPTCDDETDNGDETDVDCGGPDCDPCPPLRGCDDGDDCESNYCIGICVEASCTDGYLNNDEVDVDCGGDCALCGLGANCGDESHCASNWCVEGSCAVGLRLEQGCSVCSVDTGAIGFQILLTNLSDSAFPLGDSSVRYYFSTEFDGQFEVSCYGCPHGIQVKEFDGQNEQATHFVEVSLADSTDPLPADPDQHANVLVSVARGDGGNLSQDDDYSFRGSFGESQLTTVHRDGVLIWGTEPPSE